MMTKLEIYEKIRYNAEFEETWPDEWSEILSPLCSQEELLNDLEGVYQQMIQYNQDMHDREKRKMIPECLLREYEVKFCVIAMALGLQGDTSLIPKMFQYVPLDDLMKRPVILVGYVQEEINRCISNPNYYGASYIPVLLAHIHELVPDKMLKADKFLYTMLLDDLSTFEETHPLFKNLHLVKKKPFVELLDFSLKSTLEEISQDQKISIKELEEEITEDIPNITYEDNPLLKVAYLRQQFLKLHAPD